MENQIESALEAVPESYKEASKSLGASPLATTLTITLPQAAKGILAGIASAAVRSLGEAAVFMLVASRLEDRLRGFFPLVPINSCSSFCLRGDLCFCYICCGKGAVSGSESEVKMAEILVENLYVSFDEKRSCRDQPGCFQRRGGSFNWPHWFRQNHLSAGPSTG